MSGTAILKFFRECDMVLLGLGHEPEMKSTARAKLEQLAPVFGTCSWTLWPVMMRNGTTHFVEYFLFGRGSQCPINNRGAWFGPLPLAVEVGARLVECPGVAEDCLHQA